ncbi:hypothetical protein PVAP13_5NG126900, partial [Panicum virgatum]
IAGDLAVTADSPMEDLRNLRAVCRFLCRVASDRSVGQRITMHRFAPGLLWNDIDAYIALLAHLTNIGNPEAYYISGINNDFSKGTPKARPCIVELAHAAECDHNVAAYDDEAARRYMRQVEGEEEAAAGARAGASAGGQMLSNEGCVQCRELAFARIFGMLWRRYSEPQQSSAPVPRGDLPCSGFPCSSPVDEWYPQGLTMFCSEDCRIQHEVDLLFERCGF